MLFYSVSGESQQRIKVCIYIYDFYALLLIIDYLQYYFSGHQVEVYVNKKHPIRFDLWNCTGKQHFT